ncbi:protein Mis18-beta [Phycodurus eques]|uniref:protein Mis18-beta n=1 Tax=Phycodurus eques TaxID=693459 RepID=UPI002ACE3AE5|nr:protein Mis18-beta [Phycodurus eques]
MEFNETLLIERDESGAELLEAGRWATLHCKQCNAVLADSLSVCGELTCLDSIMCLRVTSHVAVSSEMECGKKGLANCVFSPLMCGECCRAVGKVVHAAPPQLDAARSLFLLHKAHVTCYVLDSLSLVKASAVSFQMKPLVESISEVRCQFESLFDHMKSSLADGISVSSEWDN